MNLIIFAVSVLALGVGVAAAFGWPYALIAVGGVMASVTLLATLKGK